LKRERERERERESRQGEAMDYSKSKVLPKVKKVFGKNGVKKAAAAEASKNFDDSKEEYNKEFEEKKGELHPKVIEIYEASSIEIKVNRLTILTILTFADSKKKRKKLYNLVCLFNKTGIG
jgi:hypothetical protein